MAANEKDLLSIFRALGSGDRGALLAFAEFLQQRGNTVAGAVPDGPVQIPEPESIVRPAQETVMAGLKRLSKTYPMLDKSEMLSATSELVARHIMQGSDAGEVIDRLEEIFSEHYTRLKES